MTLQEISWIKDSILLDIRFSVLKIINFEKGEDIEEHVQK